MAQLEQNNVHLPSGDRLTPNRFRTLGHAFGMSTGAEEIHYILERGLDHWSLRAIENAQKWDVNPLYHLLHESSYADGVTTSWSAHRLRPEFPQFDSMDTPYFTGEHVYPWQLDDWQRLHPMKEAALILADEPWPKLFDVDTLSRNTVPCAAAVYESDPYVERLFSDETAATVPNIALWHTDDYDHDALRVAGVDILDRLFSMVHGRT
jgi:hypothetical protein